MMIRSYSGHHGTDAGEPFIEPFRDRAEHVVVSRPRARLPVLAQARPAERVRPEAVTRIIALRRDRERRLTETRIGEHGKDVPDAEDADVRVAAA